MRSDRQHAVFRRDDRLRPPRSRGHRRPGNHKTRGYSRIASGEYSNISFIHEIADCSVEDITAEILSEAALPEIGATGADLQASHFDHIRDLRKHERA
jgi:predicted secreted Zn-dependent protease